MYLAETSTSVRACAALFDAAAQAKGLDLEVEIAPEAEGCYLGDAARIRQILSNLLGNAVKFTARGGVALRVGTTASGLEFRVSDTGIGFDAETNVATIIDREGSRIELPLQSKREMADRILDAVVALAKGNQTSSSISADRVGDV